MNNDSEGENISYEVIYNALPFMNKKKFQQIYRIKFNSLNKGEIKKVFKEDNYLEIPNKYLSYEIDQRQIIDLKIGLYIKNILKNEYNNIIFNSIQLPILYLIIDKNNQKEKDNKIYYKIYIKLKLKEDLITKIYLEGEYYDLNEAKEIIKILEKNKYIIISKIYQEKKIKSHPLALDIIQLIKLSYKYLQISPKNTLSYANNLYLNGLITYPKTYSNKYSKEFNLKKVLKKLSASYDINELLSNDLDNNLFNEDNKTNNLQIIPLEPIPNDVNMQQECINLFDFICNYFFASLSPDMNIIEQLYEFEIKEKKYKSRCNYIDLNENSFIKYYKSYLTKEYLNEDEKLEKIKYEIIEINYELHEKENYISEGEIIDDIVKHDLSINEYLFESIDELIKNKFLEKIKENYKIKLKHTSKGKRLIEKMMKEKKELVMPEVKKEVEKILKLLNEGKERYENILNEVFDLYKIN